MKLLLCAENLLSEDQLPTDAEVSGDQAAAGHEAWRVATTRRYPSNRWEPTTANANHYLQRTFAIPRAFDFVAIDRDSNHLGYPYSLTHSSDAFATTGTTVWSLTIPTVPGGALAGALGCVANDGSWLKTFPAEVASSIRLNSLAMGSGLVPQLTAVWIGKSWQPEGLVQYQHADDDRLSRRQRATESDAGWLGKGKATPLRRAVISLHLESAYDYDMVRYHVLDLMVNGHPAWVCWDREFGGRKARLFELDGEPDIDFGQKHELGARRRATIPVREVQPL